MSRFEELVAEGARVPVAGWDFSWFAGRATEERPPWGYARLMSERMGGVVRALDLQTGGGEVLSEVAVPPPALAATEGWPPNAALAQQRLPHAVVVRVAEDADLPFPDGAFDLVTSRHPVRTRFDEVARVLTPGGAYLSQQVGPGSVRELTDFMMGPQPVGTGRAPERLTGEAQAAGLEVAEVRSARLRMEFADVAAVIVFLRKVIWIVPGFTIDAYRDRLRDLHDRIEVDGAFVAHSSRFLFEARRPA